MNNVLPPQAGLTIGGVIHQYTIEKNAEDDASVIIRNENNLGNGYVYELNDNWDGLPGSTKFGYEVLPENIPREYWGDGEIVVEGNGTITDAYVAYDYRFDECYIPLNDPSCPGYNDALYQYLLDNGLLTGEIDTNDPYYDEWVQAQLEQETEVEEEERKEEVADEKDEKEEKSIEDKLAVAGAAEKITNAAEQQSMMESLANLPKFDPYYTVTIEGGTYEETISLQDKELPDNRRALRNLASDEVHRSMVRSQYD